VSWRLERFNFSLGVLSSSPKGRAPAVRAVVLVGEEAALKEAAVEAMV
jgi:hypothetical protein